MSETIVAGTRTTPRTYLQMIRAELLKLTRKHSIIGTAAFLSIGTVLLYYGVLEIQHLTNPGSYGPAGGLDHFDNTLGFLGIYFGAIAAILIGTDAGTTDTASGVFRDLVVTGRSRLALFAVRVPAALLVTLALALTALGVSIAATFAFAGGLATPSASFVIDGVLWVCGAQLVMCVIAVGLGSLTGSRAASLTILIAWQVLAGRVLAGASVFGNVRDVVPNFALGVLKPGQPLADNFGVTMGAGVAVAVLAGWVVVWLALGARKTIVRDA
jgi:ABC-type transport system involved in multi-copper enzyme maturation permease subunit